LLDPLLLLLIFSGISSIAYFLLTLKLTRMDYLSKTLSTSRDNLKSFLGFLKTTSTSISSMNIKEAQNAFYILQRHFRNDVIPKTGVIFYLMHSILNIYTIFGKPLFDLKAEILQEVGNGCKKLRKDILDLKEERFFADLCKIIYPIAVNKPFVDDPLVRHEFEKKLEELARVFTNLDWSKEKSLIWASEALWTFFDEWARREEDAISFCTALLLNIDFFPLETWYYMGRRITEPRRKKLWIIGNNIDKVYVSLKKADYANFLKNLSTIHIEAIELDTEFSRKSSEEVVQIKINQVKKYFPEQVKRVERRVLT